MSSSAGVPLGVPHPYGGLVVWGFRWGFRPPTADWLCGGSAGGSAPLRRIGCVGWGVWDGVCGMECGVCVGVRPPTADWYFFLCLYYN
jgi:hypothetical protein